ncbi:AGE family epimerase/isomerase [Nocardiopsis sp. MG754419]|uniref:AGE family epimerase/isomerase n=1 Tax=Nocardiopsis sp. MG754419 TaxID=2259865 RepID=UPI001BAD296A|nr:AGE family epimerase/isomerase [Nocardiopsis sp. MG754419]MBR8744499.1 AGE family epimerase/isomerase [Nocardiopsis sp. MG754419]
MTASTHADPGGAAWLREQEQELVGFAAGAAVPEGFGWLDAKGAVEPDRPAATWITSRMTYVFSLAHLRGVPNAAGLADHGLAALSGPLRDDDLGGWFEEAPRGRDPRSIRERSQPLPDKAAYPHAFVVLATAGAARAGRPGARALLDEALGVIDERFWEPEAACVRESWDADWITTEPYRGANSAMHCVEAFLAAADVTGDLLWTRRALAIAERLIHGVAADHDWRLPEHFTPDWTPLPDYNRDHPDHPFRPFGSTTGHLLEWARLLVHLELALRRAGEPVPEWLVTDAELLFDNAVRRGWAVDGADGFVYTLDWEDRPVVRQRMHWVVAEATMAAWVLAERTGRDVYTEHLERWWAYAERHHVDRENGSWWHELGTDNRPSYAVWPGKPDVYHAYQAVLLPQIGLSTSFVGALPAETEDGGAA